MTRRAHFAATFVVLGALTAAGCSTGVSPSPSSSPPPAATATPGLESAPTDARAGSELDTPFMVDGIVVVSKKHRVSARYTPAWVDEPHGLHPDAWAAFQELSAAATRDGLTVTLRSGYRSYAAQEGSFRRALQQYDEATARRYFAEPGASEHQTGLALDAWDGRNRGAAFARTPQAIWLAAHAHEYGFIVRYPPGKTEVTGYAWESWHLRWVGHQVAAAFGPNSTLTLEEHLGLA
ncbi:MAG: M15 family metallopeptidase [Actinomycetes bacterium]